MDNYDDAYDELLTEEENRQLDEEVSRLMTKPKDIELENKYIGYIDFNGMTKRILDSEDVEFSYFCNYLAEVVEQVREEAKGNYNGISLDFHMFSDNMIFLCDDLDYLIEYLGLFQRRLLVDSEIRMSIKGGIDFGSIYYDKDRFVLGKGLLSAYGVDKDYHNPAILIAHKLLENKPKGIIKVGFNEYVVDYYEIAANLSKYDFWNTSRTKDGQAMGEVAIIKEFIEENLKKNYKPSIIDKYLWMKDYHNLKCKKLGHSEFIIK